MKLLRQFTVSIPMNELLKLMHDTMSPVAAIKGAVNLLKGGKQKEEDGKKLLDIIDTKSDELNSILDTYYTKQKEADELAKSMEKTIVHYINSPNIFWDERHKEVVSPDKISKTDGSIDASGYKPQHYASMTLHKPFSEVVKENEGKRIFLYSTFWKDPNWNTRIIILDK